MPGSRRENGTSSMTKRFVCVWLPRFLTDRLTNAAPGRSVPPESLLAVIAPGKGGNRIVAISAVAEAAGIKPGMLLTDATAILPALSALKQDAKAEAAHLRQLAVWCRRYTPWTAPDGADGLRLDVSGAAHLFGGEAALLRDLRRRFRQAGYACRAALAATPAAAWGLARYGRNGLSILRQGEERQRLSPLPVRALRLDEETAAALDKLGLKTIGHLLKLPRSQLRARFGTALGVQLDRALGVEAEPVASLPYEPVYRHRLDFAEPVSTLDAIQVAAKLLTEHVAERLKADGKGARALSLTLYDTQGGSFDVALKLARPSHDAAHILRLFRERLAALEGRFAEDRAFDAATLHATRIEYMTRVQADLTESASERDASGLDRFIDRLQARLGEQAVRRFAFHDSHVPERASGTAPVLQRVSGQAPASAAARPFLLLPRPEEIVALAEVPDYPPRRFTWRRVSRRVVKAEGPERIAPEWWRAGERNAATRDYYAVEDETGRRYWLFREGEFTPGSAPPRWFLHGLLP